MIKTQCFLLFDPLTQTGDVVQQVLNGDDYVLDHVEFVNKSFPLSLLRQKKKNPQQTL